MDAPGAGLKEVFPATRDGPNRVELNREAARLGLAPEPRQQVLPANEGNALGVFVPLQPPVRADDLGLAGVHDLLGRIGQQAKTVAGVREERIRHWLGLKAIGGTPVRLAG